MEEAVESFREHTEFLLLPQRKLQSFLQTKHNQEIAKASLQIDFNFDMRRDIIPNLIRDQAQGRQQEIHHNDKNQSSLMLNALHRASNLLPMICDFFRLDDLGKFSSANKSIKSMVTALSMDFILDSKAIKRLIEVSDIFDAPVGIMPNKMIVHLDRERISLEMCQIYVQFFDSKKFWGKYLFKHLCCCLGPSINDHEISNFVSSLRSPMFNHLAVLDLEGLFILLSDFCCYFFINIHD